MLIQPVVLSGGFGHTPVAPGRERNIPSSYWRWDGRGTPFPQATLRRFIGERCRCAALVVCNDEYPLRGCGSTAARSAGSGVSFWFSVGAILRRY